MKTHASLEQHQCVVCGVHYDTGSLLLDKQLKQRFEKHTLTGHGFCPVHQKLKDEGYIALMEAEESGHRTGRIAHIRQEAWSTVFSCEPPEGKAAYVLPETFNQLVRMQS